MTRKGGFFPVEAPGSRSGAEAWHASRPPGLDGFAGSAEVFLQDRYCRDGRLAGEQEN